MWRTRREEVLPLICEDTGVQASLNSLCSSRNRRGRFDPCGYQGLLRRADAKTQTQDSAAKNVQIKKHFSVFSPESALSESFTAAGSRIQNSRLWRKLCHNICVTSMMLHKFGERIHRILVLVALISCRGFGKTSDSKPSASEVTVLNETWMILWTLIELFHNFGSIILFLFFFQCNWLSKKRNLLNELLEKVKQGPSLQLFQVDVTWLKKFMETIAEK